MIWLALVLALGLAAARSTVLLALEEAGGHPATGQPAGGRATVLPPGG